METSDLTPVGVQNNLILIILGSNGNLGRKLVDFFPAFLSKYKYIFCLDKDSANCDEALAQSQSIKFLTCDAISDNYIENILTQLPDKNFHFDVINLIAQDYPVTSSGLSGSHSSPFSISVNEYIDSISVTAASSYHLIKQIIDLELLSSSIWLIGSIYDRVLPSPSLYSDDNSLYKPIAYSSGKYAQIPLRNQAAVYLAPYGGRCNSLSFGGLKLDQSADFIERYSKKSPSNSLVPVSHALKMIKWALLDSPSSLNGSDILIDGAFSLS